MIGGNCVYERGRWESQAEVESMSDFAPRLVRTEPVPSCEVVLVS